jgi:hypothetical protein
MMVSIVEIEAQKGEWSKAMSAGFETGNTSHFGDAHSFTDEPKVGAGQSNRLGSSASHA